MLISSKPVDVADRRVDYKVSTVDARCKDAPGALGWRQKGAASRSEIESTSCSSDNVYMLR